ncbi:MAG: elongation factor G [Planctomycetes bacterium]|nr:elongation factor G [Planctomycetota bacterium]
MAKVSPGAVTNVALIGHSGSGKTLLTDAVLLHAGLIKSLGSIEAGTTQSDFAPEEKEGRRSIYNSVFTIEDKDTLLNIIDTPGYFDFVAQPIMALSAVENAVLTVNARTGVEVGTRKLWEYAQAAGVARMVVITRMDDGDADFDRAVQSLKTVFGPQVTPIAVPDGSGSGFTRVVNLLAQDVPDEYASLKETLVENVVSADDQMLEKYLETGEVAAADLAGVIRKAVASGALIPVVPVTAEKGTGVAEMLEVMKTCLPTADMPCRKIAVKDAEPGTIPVDDKLRGCVFKVSIGDFVGRTSYIRVYSGSLKVGDTINVPGSGSERVQKLYRLLGEKQTEVSEASSGEMVMTAKMESLGFNTAVFSGKESAGFVEPRFPSPLVSKAVTTTKRGDESKFSDVLRRIADEDPTFIIRQDNETKELVISAVGDLQLRVILERLKTRNKLELTVSPPKIPYRETVTGKGDVRYRHKKQTGGAGQFAECAITLEPNDRGAGYEFVDKIFGGSISQPFRGSVDKGVQDAMKAGALAGFPVVDVVVTLYDGKEHPVDSKDVAFQIAGRQAFHEAMLEAGPVLLEPIVNVEVVVPAKYMGDITGDMSGRRGRVVGMDTLGDMQVVKAQAPLSDMLNYSTQLQSMTQGEGFFSMEASHYEAVPSNIAQQIAAAAKQARHGGREE